MILHVDMDAFYASIEQRDDPSLRGKPVIVGGSATGRGVVCAASYEARQYGVHSAMSAAIAKRRCPNGIFLPARMNHYAEISRQVQAVFQRYTPLVEPLSLDEAFLDVKGSQRLFGSAVEIGHRIQNDIQEQLDLVASVGVAPNKFVAKVASDLEKPQGFVIVEEDAIQSFLDPLPVSRLWGVGRTADKSLATLGIRTVEQLRQLPIDTLLQRFGQLGRKLWHLSRGMDDRQVVPDRVAKSISHETTFAEDIEDHELIRAWLLELSDQVARRLRHQKLFARTIQLKIRYRDFSMVTRRQTLATATNVTDEIYRAVGDQFSGLDHPLPIRLIGVGGSSLEREVLRQKSLFEEVTHEQQSQADQAADAIRDRFGGQAVSRGSRLLHKTRHRPQPRPHD